MRRYSDTGQPEHRSFGRPGAPSSSHTNIRSNGTTVACATCRTKKIKCDSMKPACGQCEVDGVTCKYVEWKKTGLPRGYVKNLEAQIKVLKTEIEELRSQKDRSNGSSTFGNNQLPADIQLEFPSDKIQPAFSIEKYSPSAPSDFDILTHDPFEIAQLAISDILSIEDQEFLQALYFSNCHPFIPIIHKPTFDIKGDTQNTHVVLSIFALACRHNIDFNPKAEVFYSLAKQTTQATFMNPDMSTLVALLLQAVYEIGHPNTSVHSVTTVGAALALASSFRLLRMDEEHADKRNQWLERPKNWVEEEGRRRVFLMVLSISRWSATIQQRELGFPVKKEINVLLPVSDEVWFAGGLERPRTESITSLNICSDLGPFARFVQALGLYSQVNDFNQSYPLRETSDSEKELFRIDSLIQNFVLTFPPTWQGPLLDGEHLLDPTTLAMVHCASLLLHHPIVHKYKKDRNSSSSKRCSAGAENILDIIHLVHKNPKVGNYILPHPLFIAARVRLLELLEQRGHYRGRDTDLVVSALHSLGRNWGMQEKLADHAARLEANKMPFSEPLTTFEPKNEGPVPRQRAVSLVQQRSLYSRAPMLLQVPRVEESSINVNVTALHDSVLNSEVGLFPADNDIFNWPAGVFNHNWQMGESTFW